MWVVYIAEAHAVNEWQTESNAAAGITIQQHKTLKDRLACARLCAAQLGLTIPMLVDGMDNAAFEAYSAWPERIYILDENGIVRYKGGPGPYGFDVEEARSALGNILD